MLRVAVTTNARNGMECLELTPAIGRNNYMNVYLRLRASAVMAGCCCVSVKAIRQATRGG